MQRLLENKWKNCTLSTTYNGEISHRNSKNNERWYYFRSTSPVSTCF